MATVTTSTPSDGITVVTLDRPDQLNAMTAELVSDLHDAITAIGRDPGCRVVVLTGAGRAFCAGLDLHGYGSPPLPGAVPAGRVALSMATQRHIASLPLRLRQLPQPVIAAVNGPAVGGGLALVLASDIRIAGASASFGAAFVKVGLSGCDVGTSWLLPRIVGAGHAHELMLTGRTVRSGEAATMGLVVDVVPDDRLMARCLEEAALVMGNAPFGVWMTKETMWAALETPGLDAAIALENRTQVMAIGSGDHEVAVRAFLDKQPPPWAPGGEAEETDER